MDSPSLLGGDPLYSSSGKYGKSDRRVMELRGRKSCVKMIDGAFRENFTGGCTPSKAEWV
jgi:hypothetical protein